MPDDPVETAIAELRLWARDIKAIAVQVRPDLQTARAAVQAILRMKTQLIIDMHRDDLEEAVRHQGQPFDMWCQTAYRISLCQYVAHQLNEALELKGQDAISFLDVTTVLLTHEPPAFSAN